MYGLDPVSGMCVVLLIFLLIFIGIRIAENSEREENMKKEITASNRVHKKRKHIKRLKRKACYINH